MKTLALLLTFCTAFFCSAASSASPLSFTDAYDAQICRSVGHYWGDYEHPIRLKAQLYQESQLNPDARSGVGAEGIAQFMAPTWADVVKQMGLPAGANRHATKYAIDAAAFYMAQQRRFPDWRGWADPERHYMSEAAYNAGAGNIRKALRIAKTKTYPATMDALLLVTGKANQKQTSDYTQRITLWTTKMPQLQCR